VKFIWVVTSCEGRPTADVIAHYYELHYQNKKVHLHGSETTFVAQFGCISFQPSRFGDRARPALAMRTSGVPAGMAIGSIAKCLLSGWAMVVARGIIC
jgi:hypothetical protein